MVCVSCHQCLTVCAEPFTVDFGHELYPYDHTNSNIQTNFINEVWCRLNKTCNLHRTVATQLHITANNVRNVKRQMDKRMGAYNLDNTQQVDKHYRASLFVLARLGRITGSLGRKNWYSHYRNYALELGYPDSAARVSDQEAQAWDAMCKNVQQTPWSAPMQCTRILENPKAYLEVQAYVAPYAHLVHHLDYCMYRSKYKKPTTLWIEWSNPDHIWHPKRCNSNNSHEHESMQDELTTRIWKPAIGPP